MSTKSISNRIQKKYQMPMELMNRVDQLLELSSVVENYIHFRISKTPRLIFGDIFLLPILLFSHYDY